MPAITSVIEAMRRSDKKASKTNGDKVYYKHFLPPCVILLMGYYFSQYNMIFYTDFSFLYVILFIVASAIAVMKFLVKSKVKSPIIGWWSFCVSLALFFAINVVYAEHQEENCFISQVEDAFSSGYRSPSAIMFEIEGQTISFPVKNEIPIKEKLKKGPVNISGSYKKGLSSSIMITDYQTGI